MSQTIQEVVAQLWEHLEQADDSVPSLTDSWRMYLAHLLQGCLEGQAVEEDEFFSNLTLAIVGRIAKASDTSLPSLEVTDVYHQYLYGGHKGRTQGFV